LVENISTNRIQYMIDNYGIFTYKTLKSLEYRARNYLNQGKISLGMMFVE